jgi:nucleoside-diphosphate-sugar epimerase
MKPVRRESRELVRASLHASDRILVTGAGGWFGLTLAALFDGLEQDVMYVTRRPRTLNFKSGEASAIAWDWDAVKSFAPTVVIDCAFILRDYVDDMSFEEYVSSNALLTSHLLQVAGLPSVTTVLYVSSGASVHPVDATVTGLAGNPYGHMKRTTELMLESFAGAAGAAAMILRPWSLSGSLVTRPERYAFSDLMTQVVSGHVEIRASHKVLRKYVGVDDFFAVGLNAARRGAVVLNSGGELVEFEDLAATMSTVLDKPISLRRSPPSGAPEDDYYSRDSSWAEACLQTNFTPATLAQQIKDVAASLRSRGVIPQ